MRPEFLLLGLFFAYFFVFEIFCILQDNLPLLIQVSIFIKMYCSPKPNTMKTLHKTGLIILILLISQSAFTQKEYPISRIISGQQIELPLGYSFISSRIIAQNPDMLVVMASVLNENLDFVRNSQGEVLRKIGPNWVNGIGDWLVEEAYLVRMLNIDSFIIEGDAVDPFTPIQLETGFQFVSYFPENPSDALIAFETIIGENLEYIRNSQGDVLRKIGPNWINGIGDCKPGQGYLVKMLYDDILIYPVVFGEPCPGIPTVAYEGRIYNTVLIGDRCWLKENLNVGTMINGNEEMTDNSLIEKYCYDNDIANCNEYGALYQWDEMMQYTTTQGVQGICPADWHIPTYNELQTLTVMVNFNGNSLKAVGQGTGNGAGTNTSGFSALLSGYRDSNGYFTHLGSYTHFWSSTENYATHSFSMFVFDNNKKIWNSNSSKENGYSIRCIKD